METLVVLRSSEQQDLRDGQMLGVSDGQEGRSRAERVESTFGASVKQQLRRSSAPYHFDAAPQDLLSMSGAERLHCRFLGGEARRQMNGGHAAAVAVGPLAVGEDAMEKAITVLLDDGSNPAYVGRIHADADYLGHSLQ